MSEKNMTEEKIIDDLIKHKITKEELSKNQIKDVLVFLYKNYNENNKSFICDQDYDVLENYYETTYKESFIDFPSKLPEDIVKKMFKFYKIDKKFKKKINSVFNNNEKVIVTSKLDGIGCLLIKKKNKIEMFTKGNKKNGNNINFLENKINFDFNKLPKNILLKGELVLPKEYKYSRSKLNGFIKKGNDSDLEKIKFVIFDVVLYKNEYKQELDFHEKIKFLKENNYEYPYYKIYEQRDFDKLDLENEYIDFITKEKYEIDGVIFYNDENKTNIVYKKDMYFGTVKINNIEWKLNNNKIYIPILKFEPIQLNNITCKKINGFNINYLLENKIGVDSEIEIVYKGNCIPIINKVIKKSTKIVYPEKYDWTKDKKNIYRSSEDIKSISNKIEKYYLQYKIKDLKKKTIEKVLIYFLKKNIEIDNIFKYIYYVRKEFRKFEKIKEFEKLQRLKILENSENYESEKSKKKIKKFGKVEKLEKLEKCKKLEKLGKLEKKNNPNLVIIGIETDKKLKKSIKILTEKEISIVKIFNATNYFDKISFNLLNKVLYSDIDFIKKFKKKQFFDSFDEEKLVKIEGVGEANSKKIIKGFKKYNKNRDLFDKFLNINYKTYKINILLKNVKNKEEFYNYIYMLNIYTSFDKKLDYIITDDVDSLEPEGIKIKNTHVFLNKYLKKN